MISYRLYCPKILKVVTTSGGHNTQSKRDYLTGLISSIFGAIFRRPDDFSADVFKLFFSSRGVEALRRQKRCAVNKSPRLPNFHYSKVHTTVSILLSFVVF